MTKGQFPVTESTLSAEYLGQFLQKEYGFDPGTTCKLFRTGINHLYTVNTNTSKFVFRVYTRSWRSRVEISEEIRLLNHLRVNNVPVSHPVADKNDNFIQSLDAPEGLRFGVLFAFAQGQKVREFSPRTSFNIGQGMARMHKVTENFSLQRFSYSAQTLLMDPFERAKSFFGTASPEMVFVDKATKYLVEEFDKIKTDEVRSGAIHLDMWFDNMHVTAQDEITFFDFDFCGNGWLCHDIAYFILQLYNTRQNDDSYKEGLESFLAGYEEVQPITKEEKRIIPLLAVGIWFFYLGVQCDRFDNWSNVFLSEDHLRRFLSAIKKWIEYHHIPIGL